MAHNLWAGLFAAVTLAMPAAAQQAGVDVGAGRTAGDSTQKGKQAAPAAAAVAVTAGAAAKPEDTAPADSLAAGAETALLRETFTYGGAPRDPFASLIKTAHAGPELADLQLVGIYEDLRYSGNSIAVLRERTKDGKRHKLRVGDQVGRLRVTQIRPKDVVFTIQDFGYERQETLSLRKQEDLTP
ncbi:MAG TPA: hypothetical protein VFU46_06605 [Gemmatimonadales bacterium]|nr:hypothetical protein [Gemmatimonadales bacterium]